MSISRSRNTLLLALLMVIAAIPVQAATLKLGHVLPPAHNWHVAATGFADEVKAATQGRVEIKVLPNSQLGTETAMIEGLQLGTVEMGLIGGASFQNIEPKLGLESLPYAFSDHQHAYRVFDGEAGNRLFGLGWLGGL